MTERLTYRAGYGKSTVENNIKVLMELDGLDHERARKAALKVARRAFFKKHPSGNLPPYLEG
ncbi:MAG: hypothetical protein PHI12_12155 [Dehalococcoidales bacterium]|nr:hypothetical protein [Dehalococcoidales bacterium]